MESRSPTVWQEVTEAKCQEIGGRLSGLACMLLGLMGEVGTGVGDLKPQENVRLMLRSIVLGISDLRVGKVQ